MNLIDQVSQSLNADRATAEKGVGAVLSALRTTLDKEGWAGVKKAIPDAEAFVGRSMAVGGGRTAEMAPIVAPSTLLAALAAQGWKKDQIPTLARLVIDAVQASLPQGALKTFLDRAPGLNV
jgi:hypothetical protein